MVKKKIPIANIAVFILAIALFTSLFPLPFRAVSAQDPSEALVNCSDDFSDPERSKQLWRVNTHWSSIVTFEPGRLIIQNGDPFTETHVQLIFKFKDCFSFTEGTNYSISLSYRWEYDDSGAQFYMPPLQVRSRWFTVHFFNLTLRQEEGEAVGDYPFSDGSRYSKSTLASVGGWLLRWESTPTAAKRTGDLSLTDVSSGTVQLIKEGPVVTYYLNGVQLGQTDATLLEERTYRKQSLSFTVTGAAHLQDRGGGAFAGVVSRLVFEDFKIEGKPEDSVDISLKEIVPIQVIRDVPLVKDKATVVRAFVSLTGVSDLGNVPVSATVDFGGDVRTKNATLVPYGGTVYAFDDESIQANFIGWANTNNTRMIESLVSNRGIDAINFDFYPNPLRPNTNPVTIKVDIIPTGEFENRDSNLPNNSRSIQATVKDFENHLEIVFMRARPVWRDFTTAWFDFNNLVKEQYNWLVAMYPIPESKIVPIHVTGEILRVGGFFATGVPPTLWVSELVTTTTGWSGLEQVHLLAELTRLGGVMFPDAWKIVWVVPEGSMGGDGGVSYHYCKGTQSVLVNERWVNMGFTTAHEIGHSQLVPTMEGPGGHDPDDRPAADGWDPLHVTITGPSKVITNTTRYVSYMSYGAPSWSTREAYLSLMDDLVVGGRDPTLLFVSGIALENGTTLMYPSISFEGVPYGLVPGEYEAELRGSDNTVMASYSFAAQRITNSETGENLGDFFMLTVPYPDNTASVLIKRRDNILTTLTRSPNPPKLENYSVERLGDNRYILKGRLTDADNDPLTGYLGLGDGENFMPLNVEETEDGLLFEVSEGAEGNTLKLVLSDGLNTTEYLLRMPERAPGAGVPYGLIGGLIAVAMAGILAWRVLIRERPKLKT